jgi:glycosyltransferase involved in cell wall biosynthesis
MKVSIITVAKNSSSTIGQCVNSLNQQSYRNIEHIVVDGDSCDNTMEIVNSSSERVLISLSEPDNGIYDAMNKGIKLATGDIVGMLNSDDKFISKDSIQIIVDNIQENDVDCVFGNMIYKNKKGITTRVWKSNPFKLGMFEKSWTPGHPTFYCKKSAYEKYGLYKTDYKIAADVELMLRFLQVNTIRSHFIDEYLVEMLEGGVSNRGLKSTIRITKEIKKAFEENGLKFPMIKYLFYKALKIKEYKNIEMY